MTRPQSLTPLILVGFFSCIDSFDLVSISDQSSIVIDAAITDEAKSHLIQLSESYPVDTILNKPIIGAQVWIMDQDGNREDLNSGEEPGDYLTSATFRAEPDHQYTLHVILPGGEKLISRPEQLPSPVTMDHIYGKYITVPSENENGFDRGVQIFVDASGTGTETTRLRYNWTETYEVRAPYVAPFVFDYDIQMPVIREDEVHICYRTIQGTELILTSTEGLSENKALEIPIKFINQNSQQLVNLYSILIQQFSVSTDAYRYYRHLEDINEGSGSLSDKQVGTIPGNISSDDKPEKLILGYFEVSRVNEERIFFTSEEFEPYGFEKAEYPFCGPHFIDTLSTAALVNRYVNLGRRYGILQKITDFSWQICSTRCSDCKEYGTYEKPQFWPE